MIRCVFAAVLATFLAACGPSTVQDAEQAQDVPWLAEHAKAGDPDALAALCGLAKSGVDGASAAVATSRKGVDPAKSLESISCFVDLGIAGDAKFAAITRELLKAPALPVRISTLNALQAAAVDPARRSKVLAFVPDVQARLRDEEQAVWKRAILVLNAIGPEGRRALTLAFTMPERTRRRELVRDIVDLEEIAPELGPPALAWLASGEEEVFSHLLRVIVQSGTQIDVAKQVILPMLASGRDNKIDSASHLARALSDEGRCDADVVRAVVTATPRTTCEEPCLVQARSVAYKCRRVADAVLHELADVPQSEDPMAERPREIARATLGL